MSYDVTVDQEWFNITSNLSKFFIDFKVYPKEFDQRQAGPLGEEITDALAAITATDVSVLNEYNAANGWGKWEHGIRFLMGVRDACRNHPEAIVEASA